MVFTISKSKRIDPKANYDTAAAAAYLGETVLCLRQWRHRKQGPEYSQKSPGGKCYYRGSALIKFRPSLKEHRR